MKKQYLKQLIQECVNILVTENFLTEDGGAAGGGQGGSGAPGTGTGNVTANVDPIRTPKAFDHPRDIKAEGQEEPPLYVEYIGKMQGEEPFVMGGRRYEYVWAKYPSGKKDIGVYVFGQDMVVAYDVFRKWYNINESFSPGPPIKPIKFSELVKKIK